MESNYDRWNYYLKHFPSPQNYIDYSLYFMVSAALQRRVWISSGKPIYPNQYIIFVANPGVGKGLPTVEINNVIKSFKLHDNGKASIEELQKMQEIYNAMKGGNRPAAPELSEELLFPMGPDAVTYEALVNSNANSTRRHNLKPPGTKHPFAPNGIYTHNSLCFILEELSSLFRKKMEDVVNYLIKAWDCEDYNYITIGRGADRVRKTCLSLLACTQPSFMRECMEDQLLSQGFAARVQFIYEEKDRFPIWLIPPHTQDQLEAKNKIVQHIRNLGKVFGELTYSQEAIEFSRHFFEEIQTKQRINTNPKLDDFYARKKVHVHKMSIAMHFLEREINEHGECDMVIGVDSVKRALHAVESIEERMHVALQTAQKNTLSAPARKILRILQLKGTLSFVEIWIELEGELRKLELEEALAYLKDTGQILTTNKKRADGKTVLAYCINTTTTTTMENK